ncbi:GRIP protein [Spatholobus suberectus]|nr:GRIP protein [Spatholobus suberectus]
MAVSGSFENGSVFYHPSRARRREIHSATGDLTSTGGSRVQIDYASFIRRILFLLHSAAQVPRTQVHSIVEPSLLDISPNSMMPLVSR